MFRYAGGKAKLKTEILPRLIAFTEEEYREPFFGGGSIGLEILKYNKFQSFWFNDYDAGLVSLWKSIFFYSAELQEHINSFNPTTEHFYAFKEELLTCTSVNENIDTMIDIGFKKLAIHQISYSGLGTKSGGPLGGKHQKSIYKIDCRWNPSHIIKNINEIVENSKGKNIKITNVDFEEVISDSSISAAIYLDPPYYDKGNELYQCGMDVNTHNRLCDALKATRHPWVLSYDDTPEIRILYDWANIDNVHLHYTINNKDKNSPNKNKRREVIITK